MSLNVSRKPIYPSIFGNNYVISENMDIIGPGGTKLLAKIYQTSQHEIINLLNTKLISANEINKVKLSPNAKDRGGYPRITMELTRTSEEKYKKLLEEYTSTIFHYHIPKKRNRNQSVIVIAANCFPNLIGNNQHKSDFKNPQLRPIGNKPRIDVRHVSELERYDRSDDVQEFKFTKKSQ